MTIDTALFDLDGTLVEYERSTGEVLAQAFETLEIDPVFSAGDYYDRFFRFLEASEDAADLRERCFVDVVESKGYDPDLGREIAAAFDEERDPRRVRLLPGADAALDALATDHRIGVVTNGPRDFQRPKLAATGLLDRVETVVYAGHDARAKPHPEPFERALADLGAGADSAVFVGNSLESDVAGAHAAGLRSVWVPADRPDPDPEPHHALADVADLRHPPWR